eukprot:TRINITY_DN8718_c0_g1_i6.p1 TRINITY_DN8718_c0_g1~~TRINITY_DN8718_c0_g1_i6.p1  ORF type:complete len:199 (+),score=22.36 TRINITY_DN8718_c0_g1_i6:109-705(+)
MLRSLVGSEMCIRDRCKEEEAAGVTHGSSTAGERCPDERCPDDLGRVSGQGEGGAPVLTTTGPPVDPKCPRCHRLPSTGCPGAERWFADMWVRCPILGDFGSAPPTVGKMELERARREIRARCYLQVAVQLGYEQPRLLPTCLVEQIRGKYPSVTSKFEHFEEGCAIVPSILAPDPAMQRYPIRSKPSRPGVRRGFLG